jgi:hypothetical protein
VDDGDQVWQLARAVDDLRVPVMCYGLRVDFRGELFPGSAALLALADEMREVRTICHCGKKATMVIRMDADGRALTEGAQIEVGGNDRYVSLCRRHFREAMGDRARHEGGDAEASSWQENSRGAAEGSRGRQPPPRTPHRVRQIAPLGEGDDVVQRHTPHRLAHLQRRGAQMRQERDILHRDKRVGHLRFELVDIEPAPAIRPASTPRSSAASSTTSPRDVHEDRMRCIAANASAFIR